jgi:hypothetical protein
MTDDLSTVVERLQKQYNSALVLVHDDRTEHIGYYDKSTEAVEAAVLAYMQDSGFRVLHAGRDVCEVTGQKQAWVEFCRRDPSATDGDSDSDLQ